ncbi:MAG: glutaredoxin [Deltaproteobacteria bacterium]|nr:glutaredoxin [Deltaproteobacteria bacterium]
MSENNEHPPRDVLPNDRVAPAAARQSHRFHRDFLEQVQAAVAKDHVVVVGMGQNPVVRRAKSALKAAGIAFTSVDHGNYLFGYRRRLAIKMWTGFPTFPQVFVDGVLIGGHHELKLMLTAGQLKA